MRLKPSIRVPKVASVFSTLQDVLRNAIVQTDFKGNDAGKVGLKIVLCKVSPVTSFYNIIIIHFSADIFPYNDQKWRNNNYYEMSVDCFSIAEFMHVRKHVVTAHHRGPPGLSVVYLHVVLSADINECSVPSLNSCDLVNGYCLNGFGDYACRCNVGYEPNGWTCAGKIETIVHQHKALVVPRSTFHVLRSTQ